LQRGRSGGDKENNCDSVFSLPDVLHNEIKGVFFFKKKKLEGDSMPFKETTGEVIVIIPNTKLEDFYLIE
jgi:hypothetical protein